MEARSAVRNGLTALLPSLGQAKSERRTLSRTMLRPRRGPRTTGPQRTTSVTAGPSSAQLTGHAEAGVAGRRGPPGSPPEKRTVAKALLGLAVPGRPIGPWSRRTGAPKASATVRDLASVRAGSVAHRDHKGPGGHQRSPRVKTNRRSASLQLNQLARRQPPNQIAVPKVIECRGVPSRVAGEGPSTIDVAARAARLRLGR
jgi:hypothetical protein